MSPKHMNGLALLALPGSLVSQSFILGWIPKIRCVVNTSLRDFHILL